MKNRQKRFDQNLSLHFKIEIHFKLTIKFTNLRTLHCKFKMTTHYIKLCDYEKIKWSFCFNIRRHDVDYFDKIYFDEILYYYDLMSHARRYVCRATWLYSECLRSIEKNFFFCLIRQFRSSTNFYQTIERLLIHWQKRMLWA